MTPETNQFQHLPPISGDSGFSKRQAVNYFHVLYNFIDSYFPRLNVNSIKHSRLKAFEIALLEILWEAGQMKDEVYIIK